MRKGVVFILFLLFAPCHTSVFAGPPLLTGDTGTPDVGHWEINVGFIVEKHQTETRYQTPVLDMNYGLTDRIQLTLDVPWVVLHENGEDTKNGLGNSNAGVKWRFFDEKDRGLSASVSPQIEFNNPGSSSADRGLVDKGVVFLLPLQLEKKFGPLAVDLESGYAFKERGDDEWVYGCALTFAVSDHLELLGEIHGTGLRDFKEHDLLFNVGTRWKISKHCVLLASAGRAIYSSGGDKAEFLSYLGIQFLF